MSAFKFLLLFELSRTVLSYYITNRSFIVQWKFDSESKYKNNPNDTFYLPIDSLDLDSKCEV